jgi:hypothetical protein
VIHMDMDMIKVVISRCYGGFGLSAEASALYASRTGKDLYDHEIPRDDPILVGVVEELGEAASGNFANLNVVEIPADVNWYIEEYDGLEWVAERHRTWK